MIFSSRFNGYNLGHFQKDLVAGLVVGIVAIPLAMAFAIASGVRPEYGLYTSIIAGIMVSLFGGSKYQIAGPTGAFVPVLLGVVIQYGYEKLLIAGFLAGIMIFLMGLFKLGRYIKFIPRPVTIGFTAGIAVIIFSGQVANFLGLRNLEKEEAFLLNMKEIVLNLHTVNIYSVLVAIVSLVIVLLSPRFLPKIPGALLGLIISTLVAALFFPNQVSTIGSTYGAIPNKLPSFAFPEITGNLVIELLPAALVIAMLGGIESLLSALVADGMTKGKHNSNKELIGQGLANMVAPLFGGIPATGAIARTATNIKNGAASPLSGVIHGVVVLLVLVILAPYASAIPLASMAPILMFVAWNMSERKEFANILKTKTMDSLVLVTTFLLTVLMDLTTGVGIGLLLALLAFVGRMSSTLKVSKVLPDPTDKLVKPEMVQQGSNCPQINIYTVEGPLFFGSTERFEEELESITRSKPRILLLRMSKVSFIDTSGEALLANIVKQFKDSHQQVIISGIQQQPKELFEKTGLYQLIGEEYIFAHTGNAIDKALSNLDVERCKGCKQFSFDECTALSQQASKPGVFKQKRKQEPGLI
ncbi:sulfate permease [Domibacillus sp. DTU_2020_1001157_1_SI_ALB_TIR_016]|uniref:SulP family inorganic anion transporter n=1 Tax=Domibacillus sp. DTU_2020_1001157_1_SI_ALB_TIR_016 TaxID=3077789 RepID=UPI0028E41806|nr:sulfate permease [Domibacillus sp. DTU_2020_1001157_1_SI_ALB_TIR_016]WNS78668.1 sulfate permease [Domibacillus sp. DTU_2020_1001157_1_SI_ALB_TIR_016]